MSIATQRLARMMERRTRRSFLGAIGSVGVVGAGGCLLTGDAVSVLSAGSLAVVLEEVGEEFTEETGIQFQGEFHGSNVVMRMIEDRTASPDVAVSADAGLLRDRLYPAHATWDAVFGANEVGITYSPETDLGRRLDGGEPWYEVLRDADQGDLVISDPDLDPLGYRTLQMLELAGRRYDIPGLREAVLAVAHQTPNEAQLLAGVETGARAVAVSYRNMAIDRGLPFVALPAAINFSDPSHAEQYASATYTTDEGRTIRGSPVLYTATVLSSADNPGHGREFVEFLLDAPDALEANGVPVPGSLPAFNGEVPAGIGGVP
jgi:molybdate/tungstate transport system substrate-binding protein